jgi:general secretion pathway protein D
MSVWCASQKEEANMRKLATGITALLYLTIQSGNSETLITAQDYAVDSDVVLESVLQEVKSAPRDTVNVIGDGMKLVSDEVVTTAKGVAAIFKKDQVARAEKAGMIEVANAWDSSNDILFRSYKVTDEVGRELMEGAGASKGASVDVRSFFNGIDFPRKTSVYFRPEFNRLFVRHTLENILAIEDVLAEQHSAVRDLLGKQVSIETKFIEVNQSTLNDLGFRWTFTGKGDLVGGVATGAAQIFENLTLPAGQDILSQALRTADFALGTGIAADTFSIAKTAGSFQWGMTISALEQSDDTDVLSAPSIVTRDGNTATIMVGEDRAVSLGFDAGSAESSLFIEHDLERQMMGVSLEVTPEIRSDDLIDLELKPKVIDLIGYDEDYLVHPAFTQYAFRGTGPVVNGAPRAELRGRLPYYRLREMETQLTIVDGSTVGMGGLIYDKLETYKDKVPVLGSIPLVGRLFRSEGEKSVKRNLLIFVTATQVDVNGRKTSELALKR